MLINTTDLRVMNDLLIQVFNGSDSRRLEYLKIDCNFNIIDASEQVQRFADRPEWVILNKDVRLGFPELIGLENILIDILQGKQERVELKGIARSEQEFPLYIDLYVILSNEHPLEKKLFILFEDVTEKLVLEQNLAQLTNKAALLSSNLAASQTYIDKVITYMADALIVSTASGNIKTVNRATLELFGYTEAEIIGQSTAKLIQEPKYLPQNINLPPFYQGDLWYEIELICRTKSGEEITVAFSCSAISTTAGSLQDFVYVGRDITQRKRTEALLAKRQTYWEALVEIQHYLLAFECEENCYTQILTRLGKVSGASRVHLFENHQDATGCSLTTQRAHWCSGIQFEIERSKFQNLPHNDLFPEWSKVLARGEAVVATLDEFPPDERLFLESQGILSILILPLMVNGELFGCIGFDNCVETRKWESLEIELLSAAAAAICLWLESKRVQRVLQQESENRQRSQKMLQLVMDLLPQSIWWKDRNSNFLGCNRHFAKITGVETPENLIGKNDYDIWTKVQAEFFRSVDGRVMAQNQPEYAIVEPASSPNGEMIWLETNKIPLHDDQGCVIGTLGTAHDITKRKLAEEQIKSSLKEKEVLLKEIHHRVKNNLQVIESLLRLQSRYIKDKQIQAMFKESQHRIKSMALIHEKLYQSKDLAKIDFSEYVRSLVSHLLHSYGGHLNHVNFQLNVDALLSIDPAITCGLIINELVSNSLKYAFLDNPDTAEIVISFVVKGHSILSIKDNGVGFPKDLDFRDTDSLGLQLVNSLVEQLEGTIELHNQKGTEFRITFDELKHN